MKTIIALILLISISTVASPRPPWEEPGCQAIRQINNNVVGGICPNTSNGLASTNVFYWGYFLQATNPKIEVCYRAEKSSPFKCLILKSFVHNGAFRDFFAQRIDTFVWSGVEYYFQLTNPGSPTMYDSNLGKNYFNQLRK